MHEEKILSELEKAQPRLSAEERLRLWQGIAASLPVPLPAQPIISPYSQYTITTLILKKTMIPLIAIFITVLSGGATVYASDTARPGDFLYPVDRAMENLKLRLASTEETRSLLAESFTEERLHELRDIIDEEVLISPTNIDPSVEVTTANASTSIRDFEIEAHVYFDTTVVKLELEGKKFYFETTATTTDGVVVAVLGRFPVLTIDQINEVLLLENEDRESRPKDRGLVTISADGEARINHAIDEFLLFLDTASLKDVDKNVVFALLSREVEGVTQPTKVSRVKDSFEIGHENEDGNLEIKIDDDGNSKIEISDGQNRIRIAQEEGEVSVVTKEPLATSVIDEEENETVPVPEIDFAARAQIFTDQTVVEVAFGKDKIYFATQSESRESIIADILKRFPALTKEQVDEELSISLRSRASRPEDLGLESVPEVMVDPEPVVTEYQDDDEDDDREDEDEDREDWDEDEEEDEDDGEDRGEDEHEDEDREDEEEEDQNED
jgi:hypothetical protein